MRKFKIIQKTVNGTASTQQGFPMRSTALRRYTFPSWHWTLPSVNLCRKSKWLILWPYLGQPIAHLRIIRMVFTRQIANFFLVTMNKNMQTVAPIVYLQPKATLTWISSFTKQTTSIENTLVHPVAKKINMSGQMNKMGIALSTLPFRFWPSHK